MMRDLSNNQLSSGVPMRSISSTFGKLGALARGGLLAVAVAVGVMTIAATAAGCGGTLTSVHRNGTVRTNAKWTILPVQNHSETPQAGERVEAILDTLLRKEGVLALDKYPAPKDDDTHLVTSDRQRYEAALEWARTAKYDFAVTGSVEEWRYKSGIDAEPAIGVSMRVIDVANNRVVWAATGTKTGGSNDNTSATALKLLDAMLKELANP